MDNEPHLGGNRNILTGGIGGAPNKAPQQTILASLQCQQQLLRVRLAKLDTAIRALEAAPEAAEAMDDLNRG